MLQEPSKLFFKYSLIFLSLSGITILPTQSISHASDGKQIEITEFSKFNISSRTEFKGTRFGGISGAAYYKDSLYLVSDDKGSYGPPRIYETQLNFTKSEFDLKLNDIISVLSAKDNLVKDEFLDLEAISINKAGDIILSTEGHMNLRPRVPPRIYLYKNLNENKELNSEYEIPDFYLPNKSGIQIKGVRNNQAFEGITVTPDQKYLIAATEAPLINSLYNMITIFDGNKKFIKQCSYKVTQSKSHQGIVVATGISEVLAISDESLFILERSLNVNISGIHFENSIYQVRISDCLSQEGKSGNKMSDNMSNKILDKKFIYLINSDKNYEAMTMGPAIRGKRSLILVSDNDFKKSNSTEVRILLF